MKATVWVVQNSPINSQDAVNLLESIAPANEFMEKVLEFFHHPDIQKIVDINSGVFRYNNAGSVRLL